MPPDPDSLSPFALLRKLDEVMFEVRAIKATLSDRKTLDDDLVEMRHNFRIIKTLMTWVMVPAMAIMVTVVLARFGLSTTKPSPPSPWPGERLGSEQVPRPAPNP